MGKITLDFETRSRCDLLKAGAFRYAEDPSTSVLCLAYSIPGKGMGEFDPARDPFPKDLFQALKKTDLPIEAHNSQFEYAIWHYHCTPKLGWPKIALERFYCSAAKAAVLALPRSLEKLAIALKLPLEKDMTGRRLMLKMTKPRKPTKNNPDEWFDDFFDYERLLEYCVQDVVTEKACSNVMPELSPRERAIFLLDQKINDRGIYCDLESVDKAQEFVDIYSLELVEELKTITQGDVTTAGQLDRILDFLSVTQYLKLPDLKKETVETALLISSLSQVARRVLEIRQALSKASVKKLKAMKAMACEDGRIRGTLLYHGAATGRWAGKGVQPHNFIKGKGWSTIFHFLHQDYEMFRDFYPDVLGAVSACLRGMLCAPPGNTLIAGDYAAIEARVVLWLAGDEAGLDIFRAGKDIYQDMAKDIYNKALALITHEERALGKVAILGLGFGMGWAKFFATCAQWGVPISQALSKKVVEMYRERFYKVKKLWYLVDEAATQAIKRPGKVFTVGHLSYKKEGDFLYCRLPSGRKLAYYRPTLRPVQKSWGPVEEIWFYGTDSTTQQFGPQSTYGGKLVENATQGVARDIMADAMLRVEAAGYPIIMSVHDELISEVQVDFGSLKEYEELMAIVPTWVEGCPISVTGWTGRRYRK